MIHKPLISVIITTYNRAHLLPKAIHSVLNQTYNNFELIIVDDCSTDNTKEIVKSFTDSRIVYHRQLKNQGPLVALNTGWDLARGKYSCKLDDDDELLPSALETVINKFGELSSKGLGFLWFDIINAETGKYSSHGIKKEGYITYKDVLSGKIHGDYWQALDMDFLDETRHDNKWMGGSGLLWLKLLRKFNAYYIPEVLYVAHREHDNRVCAGIKFWIKHLPKRILQLKVYFKEHGEELKKLSPRRYGEKLFELGFYQILNNEKSDARKTILSSLKFNFSYKHFLLFLFSFIMNGNQIKMLYFKFLE